MYMDIKWVVKIKTDSAGNVHFEEEKGAKTSTKTHQATTVSDSVARL